MERLGQLPQVRLIDLLGWEPRAVWFQPNPGPHYTVQCARSPLGQAGRSLVSPHGLFQSYLLFHSHP